MADLRQDGIPTGEDVLPIEELWGPGATPNASGMVRRRSGERDKSPRGLRVTLDVSSPSGLTRLR